MRSYFKEVEVEEGAEGNVMRRRARVLVYPILSWFDDESAYHQLILFGSDLDWLSEMHIGVEDPMD
jgi:hypothetical protein